MKEFNTSNDNLKELKIDGELFSVREIGAGLLLDIEELVSKFTDADTSDIDKMKHTRELFDILEDLIIQKGRLTSREIIRRIPIAKLNEFINLLVEM